MKMIKRAIAVFLLMLLLCAASCAAKATSDNVVTPESPSVQTATNASPETLQTPSETAEETTQASETTETEPSTETPAPSGIVATISSVNDYIVTQTGETTVTVKGKARPAAGDTVTATIPGHYLKVKATGQAAEAILYLPDGVFTYEYRADSTVYMNNAFYKQPLSFTFTIPSDEELAKERNLAVNPYDYDGNEPGSYPHATTNNVYDRSGQFIARNAIDGYTSNTAHGNYPYESWGPGSTVRATDYFTVDLGREATVSSLELYLRADGFSRAHAHDAYFSEITLEFSNGTSVVIHPEKTAAKQEFTFDPVVTSYVKLTGFVTDKTDSDGWAAITEIKVIGSDAVKE